MALDGGDKSTGVDGVRKAKRAAIVRLLRSVRCQRIVLQSSQPDDYVWVANVLRDLGLNSARVGQGVSDVVDLLGENDNSAEGCKLIVSMDVPDKAAYMRTVTETDDALPIHAIVTLVTPSELVTLKSFTQPKPEWKIKPLPEVLPGLRHDGEDHQQRSSAEVSSMPEGIAAGSMHEGQRSEEAAQGQKKPQSAEEELQFRKQQLLQTLDVLGSQSSQPAAIPATSQSHRNGHGHVNQGDSIEDEVPPPPLGSPRASQATAAATTGTTPRAGAQEAAGGAAAGGHRKASNQAAVLELNPPQFSYPAALEEGGEWRARQRSAQDAAARKEEQQELALERAILEIHWRQAAENEEDDFMDGEAGGLAEDEEVEEGELTAQEPAEAEDQPMAAAGPEATAPWHQHLPPFYQQWGRSASADSSRAAAGAHAADAGTAAHAEPSSEAAEWDEWYQQQGYSAPAADAGAGASAQAGVQALAWDEWYRQQGYSGQDAPAQQGAGGSGDGTAAGLWEQWHSWQQQQGTGATDWGSWPAGSQPIGPSSWAAQGLQAPGKEGFVSVPVALVQRYQMLEWAEWNRQYERWQAAYEQWHTWWTSIMWQSSAYYSGSTDHNPGVI